MTRHQELDQLGDALQKETITRRTLIIKGLALGFSFSALAPILAACGSSGSGGTGSATASSSSAAQPATKVIRGLMPSIAMSEAAQKQFTVDTGYVVEPVFDTLTGMMTKMLTASDQYDFVSNNSSYHAPLWDAGIVAPIPAEKVPNWQYAMPLFTDSSAPGSKDGWPIADVFTDATQKVFKGVPHGFNFEAMGYNHAKIPSVTSYGALFDPQYKNRVSIWNDATWTIGMTANYLLASGQMPTPANTIGNLTTEEVDKVIAFLTKKKQEGQFRAIWSDYGQAVNLLASQEVLVSDAWNPAFNDAAAQSKLPLLYINPKEGNRPWFHSIALSAKAKNPEGVYALANWMLAGWYGADLAPIGWYSPATTVKDAMKPADYAFWYLGKGRDSGSLEARAANIAYWVSWPDEAQYYLSTWSSFLAS